MRPTAGFSVDFLTVINSNRLAASDVTSGIVVDPTRRDVSVKFGDYRSYRNIRLPHFVTDERRRPTDPVVIGQNAV